MRLRCGPSCFEERKKCGISLAGFLESALVNVTLAQIRQILKTGVFSFPVSVKLLNPFECPIRVRSLDLFVRLCSRHKQMSFLVPRTLGITFVLLTLTLNRVRMRANLQGDVSEPVCGIL